MLPWDYLKKNYGEYWMMPYGEHKITILFDKNIPDAADTCAGIIDNVVYPVFLKFNDLNLDMFFTITNWDIVEKPSSAKGVIAYQYHGQSKAYMKQSSPRIIMGYWEDADYSGRQHTLLHEMIHALGFGHKGTIIDNHRPAYDIGELNKDDIHGLYTVYDIDAKYRRQGTIGLDTSTFKDRQAFLIDKTGRLKYQSPIDKNGHFEFRSNSKLSDKKILYILTSDWGTHTKMYYSFDGEELNPIDSYMEIPGIKF